MSLIEFTLCEKSRVADRLNRELMLKSCDLSTLHGVKVIGIDLNEAATNWARKHCIGTFYNTNGGNLSWISGQTFNHFFLIWCGLLYQTRWCF